MQRTNCVRFIGAVIIVALALVLVCCATVPITGRKQVSLVSDTEVMAMSYQQYDQFLAENQLSQDAKLPDPAEAYRALVEELVDRLEDGSLEATDRAA